MELSFEYLYMLLNQISFSGIDTKKESEPIFEMLFDIRYKIVETPNIKDKDKYKLISLCNYLIDSLNTKYINLK